MTQIEGIHFFPELYGSFKFCKSVNFRMNDLCENPHCTKYMWEITYMLLHSLYLTIVMIIIKMFVLYYMFVAGKNVKMFTAASTVFI